VQNFEEEFPMRNSQSLDPRASSLARSRRESSMFHLEIYIPRHLRRPRRHHASRSIDISIFIFNYDTLPTSVSSRARSSVAPPPLISAPRWRDRSHRKSRFIEPNVKLVSWLCAGPRSMRVSRADVKRFIRNRREEAAISERRAPPFRFFDRSIDRSIDRPEVNRMARVEIPSTRRNPSEKERER